MLRDRRSSSVCQRGAAGFSPRDPLEPLGEREGVLPPPRPCTNGVPTRCGGSVESMFVSE